jgi:hypothetical protein
MQKLIQSLKLRMACGIDGILNERLRHLQRRPLVYFTHLFNHCLRFSHFRKSWEDAKITALPKRGKDPKFLQNVCPISLSANRGKIKKKNTLKMVQSHAKVRDLLNASQFGFREQYSTTLQCVKLTDHTTSNFNNNMYTTALFLDIEKVFATTQHHGLLYKLHKLKFSTNLIKRNSSFLSQ